MKPLIATVGLAKRYGDVWAVRDLSLEVAPGTCLALLGHNGAGKTTLMKMLLGLAPPSAGQARVLGERPGAPAAKAGIGFLPESIAFQDRMTGVEVLTLFARLKREPVGCVGALLERVGLGSAGRARVRTYSKGMKQRLGLAQALIGRPRLLLLDEPTSGLDPLLRQTFYELIDELKGQGASVLLSSHVLTELEAHADRVAIMRQGELVADDRLAELARRTGLPVRIKVRLCDEVAGRIAHELGGRELNGRAVELTCPGEGKVDLLRRLTSLPVAIDDVELAPPSLNDIYAHFSRGPRT
jgi:Cu-processing system ATP-binding protein